MKKITSYIPCYIWNDKKFYEWLEKTIDSIKLYHEFGVIKLFVCQKEKEKDLRNRSKKYNNIEINFLEENTPMYFPIDVFNYMKNDKNLSDEDYIYYVEWDHILYVNDWFFRDIYEELDKWNVVMPHRLWKIRAVKNIEYKKYEWLYVGNYGKSCTKKYNDVFNEVLSYKLPNNRIYWTYAWCYFIKKSRLCHIEDIKIWRKWIIHLIWRYIWFFHKYWLFKNFGLPYTLRLEAPSLILPFRWLKILKSIYIWNCYVEHLSQNWYV